MTNIETISSVWSIDDQTTTVTRNHDSVADAFAFYTRPSFAFDIEMWTNEIGLVEFQMHDTQGHYIVNVQQADWDAIEYL